LSNLLSFYKEIEKWSNDGENNIGDLDEFPANRSLIDEMVENDYIHTWIEDGRGISFTCWGWNVKAIEELTKNGIKDIIDPTEEYS